MATLGTILIAIIIVGMQVLHSRANDRRLLAKWQRLPVFVYGSPKVYRRKAALTWYVWLSGFMAAVLVALTLWFDINQGSVRSDRQIIIANAAIMLGWMFFIC